MAAGIASGFVRKLYRILDQESESVVGWDTSGLSFSIHDSQRLNDDVLPRYFRGRMSAFRQQLLDHGFQQIECEDNEARECYAHPHFLRGCPDRLSFIVRNPKPKLKPGQTSGPTQPAPQPQTTQHHLLPPSFQHANGHHLQQPQQQPSLGIHIAPTVKGPGRAPLTVTLTAGKRASSAHNAPQVDFAQKRLRGNSPTNTYNAHAVGAAQSQPPHQLLSQRAPGPAVAPAPPSNLNQNPLFSNEPSSELGLDVARVFSLSRISDSGLLPNSTDLPEPISYLTRLLHGNASTGSTSAAAPTPSSSSTASSTTASQDPPVFSEDLMKSALYFLVSTSTTGVGPDQKADGLAARMERASTSGFLSSLLVSSATGKDAHNGAGGALSASSVWGSAGDANPLFSRSTEQDEEEDSIWNLLLASSIDRVKTAIQDVTSPHERLRMILEERERLEEQRKRIYGNGSEEKSAASGAASGPHKPTDTQSAKPLKSALKKPATANPLFAAPPKTLLFTGGARSTTPTNTTAGATPSNPLFSDENDDDENDTSTNPLFTKVAAPANALFTKDSVASASSSTSADSKPNATATRPVVSASTAEDGLWRLLMTSSVDWLRKGAAEFEV